MNEVSINHSSSRCYRIGPHSNLGHFKSVEEALASLKDGHGVWFDFANPSREELNALIEPLGLHPLAVEDCFDEDQIPKIEDFPTNTFILFNQYHYEAGEFSIRETDFFLGKNFLVTVNLRNGGEEKYFEKLDDSIRIDPVNARRGPDFLMHVILDFIVDEKFKAIEMLQEDVDIAEEQILKDPGSFNPGSLMNLRHNLLSVRKSLFHEREILVRICRRDSPFINEKAIYHFRDIYDHLAKFFELSELYRETIAGLMEMYLSMLNNKLTKSANRTNMVVRRLTLITTIFMPLTLLASIGGMSEWSMMTGAENWKISYPLFLIGMIVIGFISYLILKKLERYDEAKETRELED